MIFGVRLVWNYQLYSQLNTSNQNVEEAKGNIDTQTSRRASLVPNLVKVVQGYAKHEEKVFTEVAEARARAGQVSFAGAENDPAKIKAFNEAQAGLSSALQKLMVVVEQYPELKAAQGFQDLQHQLEGCENRIQRARELYNAAVKIHNTNVKGYFMGGAAQKYGYQTYPYFEGDAASQATPEVNL